MSKSAWPLQTSVYSALSSALAPVPVFDDVPTGQTFPYVTIGETTSAAEFDKSEDMERITLTIHAWSRKAGRKEAKELAAKIANALHNRVLTMPGFAPATLRYEFTTDMIDPDGITKHAVVRVGTLITTT